MRDCVGETIFLKNENRLNIQLIVCQILATKQINYDVDDTISDKL